MRSSAKIRRPGRFLSLRVLVRCRRDSIVLSCASGNLLLTLDEKGIGRWCQVDLLMAGVRRLLGAERLTYIAAHLASFLADTSPGNRWGFSLSGLHTSAYGEHVGGGTVLHLQDTDAKMFARLVLTPAEKSRWMQQLAQHTRA